MNKTQGEVLIRELDDAQKHLTWQDDRGILDNKTPLRLVPVLRPLLKALVDIADSLESIANR